MNASKKIGFNKANSMFKYLVKYRAKLHEYKEKEIIKSPFLLLSNLFERNIFSNESCSLDTLFLFGKLNKQLEDDFYISLTTDQRIAFSIGRLFGFNYEFKFSTVGIKNVALFLIRAIKTIISFGISLADAILIITLCFSYTCFSSRRKCRNSLLSNRQIDELYSIHYWSSKKSKSPMHYYPDFGEVERKIAYVSTFFQYRFIFKGLLDALPEKNIVTALDFVDISMLIKSLKALIRLYIFDFSILKKISFGRLVANIDSLKLMNARLYSLLSYYSSEDIINRFKPDSIYLWGENQLATKAVSLGLGKSILQSRYKEKIKLFTFFGYPYNRKHFPHLTPSLFELRHNVWASNNFMFLDKSSENEMRVALEKYEPVVNYFEPRATLNRYLHSTSDQKLTDVESSDRVLTFFSDSSLHDLITMLFRFYSNSRIKNSHMIDINTISYIRLHPSLNPLNVRKSIHSISKQSNFFLPHFQYIDNTKENVSISITRSRVCVFSNSSIVNQAIDQGKEVIAIKTSFMYDPPIINAGISGKSITLI